MGWPFDKLKAGWPFTKRSRHAPAGRTLIVRAKFDSAQTNADNRRHWANADGLSADAAANPEVRRTLRNRARYEIANNSYARGIVLTLANDVTGTGPRLQMLATDTEVNRQIEAEFAAWAKDVDLPGKLRTMRMARAQDGETFGVLFSNDKLNSPVKLDLKLIEADQVATPSARVKQAANSVDGIVFDAFGNPVEYHLLKAHPGASGALSTSSLAYDRVPAASVIHWFRTDRPGQRRLVADGKVLEKHFATGNFRQTMAFANRIAEIAAEQGHHPDLHFSYQRVIVPQTTHAVGGLSENDFIVTARIDEAIDEIANRRSRVDQRITG